MNGHSLDLFAEGYVEAIPYGDNDIYYEGELLGEKNIDGISYAVSAGFQKLESAETAKVGLVLTPESGDFSPIILIFGQSSLSIDDYEALTQREIVADFSDFGTTDTPEVEADDVAPYDSGDTYYVSCSVPAKLSAPASLNEGARMNYYFSTAPLRGILAVKTNCAGVVTALNKSFSQSSARASNIFMQIERTSGNGYIAGFEDDVIFPKGRTVSISQPFRDGIVEILSWVASKSNYEIPSFFMNWISNSLTGKVVTSNGTKTLSAEYKFGLLDNSNFDNGYLPVTYQFNAGTGGKSYFTCSAKVKYRCSFLDSMGDSTIIYLETASATHQFSFNK